MRFLRSRIRGTGSSASLLPAAIILVLGSWTATPAADAPEVELLWSEGFFTEGPAVAPDGTICFIDYPFDHTPGRVFRFDPETNTTRVLSADSGKANGMMFDRQGRLIACCGSAYGKRALCRIDPDGTVHVLVDRYQGKRLNSPNDLVIDARGRIYFSDPRYLGPEPMELDHMSVYRFDPDGSLQRLETGLTKPTGLVISPDWKTMYIGESDNGSTTADPPPPGTPTRMTLNSYPIREDGLLGPRTLLVDYGQTNAGVDGMTVDVEGNVYAAVTAWRAVVVYTPEGQERHRIEFPEPTTNCCFGHGAESSTLYVTAGKSLYRVRLEIDGFHPATSE